MKTYRVKERINEDDEKQYVIQRKSIFGFWYTLDMFNFTGDRDYYSELFAQLEIKRLLNKE